jgi:hypothetical protein
MHTLSRLLATIVNRDIRGGALEKCTDRRFDLGGIVHLEQPGPKTRGIR